MLTAARFFAAMGAAAVVFLQAIGTCDTPGGAWRAPWRAPRWACDACAAAPQVLYFRKGRPGGRTEQRRYKDGADAVCVPQLRQHAV